MLNLSEHFYKLSMLRPGGTWWLASCVLVLVLAMPLCLLAEGSKELSANGGNRASLVSTLNGTTSYPFPTRGLVKVYVKAGETIYAGSSAQGYNSGRINLRAPDGAVYSSGTSTTVGLIRNRTEELVGPAPNAGGYTPYTQTATTAQEGIWEIDFLSPDPSSNTAGVPVAAGAPWAQYNNEFITAFDVSVRNAANNAFLTGRVFTNIFCGLLGSFNVGFNGIFYILTKDGYQYKLDNNGQAGNGFSFFSNNKGFRAPSGAPSYKSINDVLSLDLQDPRMPDTESDVTHKLFFNPPAADLPATSKSHIGPTWLLNPPFSPTASGVNFTGKLGTVGKSSTVTIGGAINFNAATNGTYIISMDIDRNGAFNDAIDRTFTGTVNAGANRIDWDGLDGLGASLPHDKKPINVNINLSLFGAEVHFPFFDVERNVNGILLTRTNGFNSPDDHVYWDDSNIVYPGSTPSNPQVNLNGISSAINGHKWGTPTTTNSQDDFGNNRSIDTWAYVKGNPFVANTTFLVQDPHVPNGVIIPTVFTPNGDGKNDTFFITDLSYYPGAKLSVFNRWGNEVYRSNDYQNDWDGAGLSEGTYFYTLKVDINGSPTTHKGWIYLKRQ